MVKTKHDFFNSFGLKVFIMYLITDQLLPLFLNTFLFENIITPWKKVGVSLEYVIALILSVVLVVIINLLSLKFRQRLTRKNHILNFFKYLTDKVLIVQALIFIASATVFLLTNLANYRYDENIGASSSGIIMLSLILKSVFLAYLFWYLMFLFKFESRIVGHDSRDQKLTKWMAYQKKVANLAVVGMFLTINGTMTTFTSLFFAVLVNSVSIRKIIYTGLDKKNIFRLFYSGFWGIAVFFIAFGLGESIKRSLSVSDVFLSLGTKLSWYFSWMSERLSVWYYSATYLADKSYSGNISYIQMWDVALAGLNYRLGKLLGLNVDTPIYHQLSHYHYFDLSGNPTLMDAGASPGVLGSSLYLFPFWIAPLFFAVYISILIKLVNHTVDFKISWIGAFLACMMLRSYFLDPSGILLIFNGPAIYFVAFFALWIYFTISFKLR